MNVLHTIPDMGSLSGGPTTCTYDLLSALNRESASVKLVTLDVTRKNGILIGEGEEWMTVLPNDSFSPVGYSRNLKVYLEGSASDIYHTNGLWKYCNHITCFIARKQRKPYLITTHGMLYPMALRRSYWKKLPLLKIWFEKDIKEATCIHATCKQEMEHIRSFGYHGPIAVIANPVPIYGEAESLFKLKSIDFHKNKSGKRFGFLGRLHPVKRVENLLYGAALIKDRSSFEIVIIGEGEKQYKQFLLDEVARLSLSNVSFAGFVAGEEKYSLLSELSALFVPSEFENFGMIVTEALSVGTPVMASLGTPWEDLNSYECGWWQDCTPENIASVMESIITMPTKDLLSMGERGINLVKSKYAANKIASEMTRLYDWIINNQEKPEFVYE